MKNITLLNSIIAGIALTASTSVFAQEAAPLPQIYSPDAMLNNMSDNGMFAIATTQGDTEVDNPHDAGGRLLDLSTRQFTNIPAPSGWANVSDVADDGTVVGAANGRPGYWKKGSGWTTFDVPAPWGGGSLIAVTPDAAYAVGYMFDPYNEFNVAPLFIDLREGTVKETPNIPTADMEGENKNQNLFYGISPDGRYLLGQMSQSYIMPPACFSYIYDTQENTWNPVGYDYNAETGKFTPKHPDLHFISNQFLSTDGKWVTGIAYMVSGDGEINGGSEGNYPYLYNVEDGSFTVYYDAESAEIAGNKVSPDGAVLGCSPAGSIYPSAMIRSGKYFISLDQIITQVYNTTNEQLIGDPYTGSFQAVSTDGLTALMVTYDNTYIITMGEPFTAAAARVDLLGNYSLNIPSGSAVSSIGEIQVTFDREIECLNLPSGVRLLDKDGNTVRTASGFTVAQANPRRLVVTFRTTSLNPGEQYTIDIPEGYVWIKDDTSVKSKNIRISYTGRSAGAVRPISISPASGSAVAQFNSSPDYISIRFDAPVKISDTGSCALYNADDGTLVNNFAATTSGNFAYFYPTSAYHLYKGSNYKVSISAGTVTDLAGAGGCEAIELEYRGAYVRELSSDDIYIFQSSCNDYDNFIFWQNEQNTPAAIPASWGFVAENPWLLVRSGEESVDMALAAHSMFTPAAESDDWLVLPQLFIPDANTSLAFDAQSYLNNKADVLRVYVREDNAVYNYFSTELTADFRENGDLVFEQTLSPGESEEGLEDDWQHVVCDLAPYAGKNIYIAFVNNNNDQSAIFLDNIAVMRNVNFLLTNSTPAAVVNASSVKVSGLLSAGMEGLTFNGVSLNLKDADGTLVSTIDDSNAVVAYGDAYTFTFPEALSLEPGKEVAYTIEVASGTETSTYAYSVKDLVFQPVKKVVLEEFTGSSCGNCPQGIRAIESLQGLYPDNFIPITLRTYNNDYYSTGITGYTAFLGLSAAPSARVNRGDILYPMLNNAGEYTIFGRGIIQSDGTEAYLWADAVQDELNTMAEASVDFSVTYKESTGELTVPCTVKFALDQSGRSVGVFAVVLEDALPCLQENYFSTVEDPIFGEWGRGGAYGQPKVTTWLAEDVSRFVITEGAYNGRILEQSDFIAGEECALTLSATIPSGRLYNPANCKVVVMLVDGANGRIINANLATFGSSGIEGIEADSETPVYYNLQGCRIANPEAGRIYIRVIGGKASKIIFQ